MGQQLRIRLKRLRRKRWIDRKKKASKIIAKPVAAPAPAAAKP